MRQLDPKIGRAWAELVEPGGTKIRFHYPCGHTSVKDYSKGPIPKRMGVAGCKLMADWWSKEHGGVTADCPTCLRKQKRERQTPKVRIPLPKPRKVGGRGKP